MCYEPYFYILINVEIRQCLTGFRISSNILQIEMGQYKNYLKKKDYVSCVCLVMLRTKCVTFCKIYENKRQVFYDSIIS